MCNNSSSSPSNPCRRRQKEKKITHRLHQARGLAALMPEPHITPTP